MNRELGWGFDIVSNFCDLGIEKTQPTYFKSYPWSVLKTSI